MNTTPITQDERSVAQRNLKMVALSLPELEALIEAHRNNPPFASQVIASAARQMLEAKRAMLSWLMLCSPSSFTHDDERAPRALVRA